MRRSRWIFWRWPTLEELQRAKPATLQRFLAEHQCRDEAKNQNRIEAMRKAIAATTDGALVTAGRMAVMAAVHLLRQLHHSIQQYDTKIDELAKAHPDFAIFDSLPGAGPVMGPRLIAAFGTLRDRYQSAADLQRYSGIAPVTEASGQQKWVHWRWSCPKFLRQTFQEWAGLTMQDCDWAAAYYQVQRDKGKSHYAAVRALAYKWIRIAFRCWKDHKPYDDSHYENALRRRTPAAPEQASLELPIAWISCGGFQKIVSKNR